VGASVATRLLMDEVHGPKNVFSEFMDLSDTNYKFMNLKNAFSNFMDLYFQSL
jgi:hypothetical protein